MLKSRIREKSLSDVLFIFFSFCILVLLTYGFYVTEIRDRFENLLFDFKTVVKPALLENPQVAVILVEDELLEKLPGDQYSALDTFQKVSVQALEAGAKAVVPLLLKQDFTYEASRLGPLLELIDAHDNFYLGVFEFASERPTARRLSQTLEPWKHRIYSADSVRLFKDQITRKLPVMSYSGEDLEPHLVVELARTFNNDAGREMIDGMVAEEKQRFLRNPYSPPNYTDIHLPHLLLNYRHPGSIETILAGAWMRGEESIDLKGKIVILGHYKYRGKRGSTRETSRINTPWQSDGTRVSFENSFPISFAQAVALDNLLSANWLRNSHWLGNVLWVLIFAVMVVYSWRWGLATGILGYLVGGVALVYLQSVCMSWLGLHFRSADMIVLGTFVLIIMAIRHSFQASSLLIFARENLRVQSEISGRQEKFLSGFAGELIASNDRIFEELARMKSQFSGDSADADFLQRSIESNRDLAEYLDGMNQFSKTMNSHIDFQLSSVDIVQTTAKVIKTLKSGITQKGINLYFQPPERLWVLGDDLLLSNIIYNLLSNAIKYSPENSEIDVSLYENEKACLVVGDSGPGIPQEEREKVFEKFYRVMNDDVYSIKGNGIGLFLSNFFAAKIGATIDVGESFLGGAEFKLICQKGRQQ